MASSRQLSGKVTEKQLIKMLEQFSEQTKPKTKITIQRKKNSLFDDDDEDIFNSDSD
jgi:DNA topoisomerase VI subunit A